MLLKRQNIFEQQQNTEAIQLLRASNVSNRATRRLDGTRLIIGLITASFGVTASFLPDLRPAASIIGALAALLTTLVWSAFRTRFTTRSAIIQDQFDRGLFHLSWPSSNPPMLIHAHLANLARHDHGDHDTPWYADVRGVPSPVAETYCQRESLVWDSDLRAQWINVCVVALITLGAGIVLAGLALQVTLWEFILWFAVPMSSLLSTLAVNLNKQLRDTRIKKVLAEGATMELDRVARDRTAAAATASCEAVETRQRELFNLRADGVRVPNWFYKRFKNQFESNHAADATQLRAKWDNWTPAAGK